MPTQRDGIRYESISMARVFEIEESKRTDTTASTASRSSQVFNYVSLISVSANSHCSSRAIVPRNSTCHMHSAPSPSSNFLLLLLLLLRIRISDISIRFYSGSSPPFTFHNIHPSTQPSSLLTDPRGRERESGDHAVNRGCGVPAVFSRVGALSGAWYILTQIPSLEDHTAGRRWFGGVLEPCGLGSSIVLLRVLPKRERRERFRAGRR